MGNVYRRELIYKRNGGIEVSEKLLGIVMFILSAMCPPLGLLFVIALCFGK